MTPPPNAALIWIEGDKLMLGLRSETATVHAVAIPLDKCVPAVGMLRLPISQHRGFAVLLDLLRDRARQATNPTIGLPGAQPKASLESAVASDERYKAWLASRTTKARDDLTLEDIGL